MSKAAPRAQARLAVPVTLDAIRVWLPAPLARLEASDVARDRALAVRLAPLLARADAAGAEVRVFASDLARVRARLCTERLAADARLGIAHDRLEERSARGLDVGRQGAVAHPAAARVSAGRRVRSITNPRTPATRSSVDSRRFASGDSSCEIA